MKVVIVGAGLAGLNCALHLKRDFRIFERESRVGGLCRTEQRDGFTIDHSGHYLHFKDQAMQAQVAALLKGNLMACQRNSWVFLKGVYTPYPFQAHLYGHGPQLRRDCVLGLFRAQERAQKPSGSRTKRESAAEWVRRTQGDGFARHFMFPFNEKQFHAKLGDLLPAQWGRFLPVLNPQAIVRGALKEHRVQIGYNVHPWHPRRGGIEALPRAMADRLAVPVETRMALTRVRWKERIAEFAGGEQAPYDVLVTTAPLPELLRRLDPVPRQIARACDHLRWIGVLIVHLCVRNPRERKRHWIYFPESRYVFYRFGIPTNINPADAPRGHGVISAEVSYVPGHRPRNATIIRRVKRDLRALKMLGSDKEIVDVYVADFPCAYVVFDRRYDMARNAALRFLARNRILSIGRFGGWVYGGMEDALKEGKTVAEKIRAWGPRVGSNFFTSEKQGAVAKARRRPAAVT